MRKKSISKKMNKISYNDLKIQPYITAKDISNDTVKEIFKYRTHMLDFDDNFKGSSESPSVCKLCKSHSDSQDRLEDCIVLQNHHKNMH